GWRRYRAGQAGLTRAGKANTGRRKAASSAAHFSIRTIRAQLELDHGSRINTADEGTRERSVGPNKMIHDFTVPGGLMPHALPFAVHLEHGFFNYQPNLFDALARFNSYQTLDPTGRCRASCRGNPSSSNSSRLMQRRPNSWWFCRRNFTTRNFAFR